jgi:AGCS family alanine or glycine:cation symporter
MSETFTEILADISSFVWGWPLMILLIGTGLWLTVSTRGFQFRILPHALALIFKKHDEKSGDGDISNFQALMTALAATVGTGNIVGVATAIALGGPGAVFWLWVTGLVGMVTKYAEALLAVEYRIQRPDGSTAGGPMYYIEKGLKCKPLAIAFAIFTVFASFGIGNMVQCNTVAESVKSVFALDPVITGIVLIILSAPALLFGIKGIARITSVIVPFMIVSYIVLALGILVVNAPALPKTFALIFKHAFSPTAAAGGFVGAVLIQTIRAGLARGLFSNESGLGSAPIVAAAARTKDPITQAMISMTQTFIDTLVICSLTALLILSSDSWLQVDAEGEALTGLALTTEAFRQCYGIWGKHLVSVATVFFAWSTLIGWSYYGEKALEYLSNGRGTHVYRLLYVGAIYLGCTFKLETVFTISDIFNGLMAFPNLVALVILSPFVIRTTREFCKRRKH